jgi:hypothetical protein
MNVLMRWTAVLILMLSGMVGAQTPNLVGQWQGTLGGKLRLIFVMTAAGQGNTLSTTMYSIDQTPAPINLTTTVQGGSVRLVVTALGASFDGKVSADGNSIVGTWAQGGGSAPLTIERANKETAWDIPAPPRSLAADAPMTFEVATIKPSDPARATGPASR